MPTKNSCVAERARSAAALTLEQRVVRVRYRAALNIPRKVKDGKAKEKYSTLQVGTKISIMTSGPTSAAARQMH